MTSHSILTRPVGVSECQQQLEETVNKIGQYLDGQGLVHGTVNGVCVSERERESVRKRERAHTLVCVHVRFVRLYTSCHSPP